MTPSPQITATVLHPERRHPCAVQEILRSRKAQVPVSQAVTCFGIKYDVAGIFYLGYILGVLRGRLPTWGASHTLSNTCYRVAQQVALSMCKGFILSRSCSAMHGADAASGTHLQVFVH